MTVRQSVLLATIIAMGPAPHPLDAQAPEPCDRAGLYAIGVPAGGDTLRGQIDLGCRDGRHWGRFLVVLRDTFVTVLAEDGRAGDTLRFISFGGAQGAELRFVGDSLTGALMTGARSLPFGGLRRSSGAPAWLDAHAPLRPWPGLAAPPDSGQSYPVPLGPDSLVFTRHGNSLAWQRIMLAVRRGDTWEARPLVPALDPRESQRGPTVAPDGALWFAATRPDSVGAVAPRLALWTAPRGGAAWETPARAGLAAAESGSGDQQPSVTRDGWVYFTSHRPGGLGDRDVWRFRPTEGAGGAEALPAPVNGAGDEHGVWVSPDHRMMIVSSSGQRAGRVGGDDLYLVVRTADGWGEPRVLPVPVNSFGNDYGAMLDRDGRTLWFTSDRFGIAELFQVDLRAMGIALP